MLDIALKKNDKQANLLIITLSVVVFVAVAFLKYVKFPGLTLGFNAHILALVNAVINGTVSVLLVAALLAVKQKKYAMHRNIMFTAMALSALFLVSYIGHHLLAPETPYGNPDSAARVFYFTILITHI
ncbi:MAG: DUF420 domain-containing protein, partial [Chitinophagia bacterium]|nr:DUF420 domain-containing protein [Chitinophagia bacterium]